MQRNGEILDAQFGARLPIFSLRPLLGVARDKTSCVVKKLTNHPLADYFVPLSIAELLKLFVD
jgi:hypothetical protein